MNELPKTSLVLAEQDGSWLTLWFNRPQARNALSEQLSAELRLQLEAARQRRDIRGLTLRGKGGIFCAGGDLKGFKSNFQGGGQSLEDVAASSRAGGELFGLINTMPQPVVMLVEGAAVAGGMGIVCAGDVVIVTRDSKFALTETTLGIPPAQIAPFVVQRLGLSVARRLMLTAARFDGEKAGQLGLADFVVADAAEAEQTEAAVRKNVLRCAPGANAATKELVLAAGRLEREQMLRMAGESFARCMLSDEGREGIASFLEKRKPQWAQEE